MRFTVRVNHSISITDLTVTRAVSAVVELVRFSRTRKRVLESTCSNVCYSVG